MRQPLLEIEVSSKIALHFGLGRYHSCGTKRTERKEHLLDLGAAIKKVTAGTVANGNRPRAD